MTSGKCMGSLPDLAQCKRWRMPEGIARVYRPSPGKLGFLLVVLLFSLAGKPLAGELKDSFVSPPASARPWVYWFWMNGNITKEGITADLEAMHRAGIGGTLIMHVGAGIPAGPVKFFSDPWRALFQHALQEAHRLGLEVTMNACDGWTGTGGPWIQPEEAMMKLVWTETRVSGPSDEPISLPQPETNLDVYHDIAVLAFPAPPAEAPAAAAPPPTVTASDPKCAGRNLIDGDLDTAAAVNPTEGFPWIQFAFPEPFTARAVRFTQASPSTLPATAKIQASVDGKSFRTIADVTFGWRTNIASTTIALEDTSARFFRVVLPAARAVFREIEFLDEARVNYWELKAGFGRRWGHGADEPYFAMLQSGAGREANSIPPSWARQPERFAVDADSIQDISARMAASGELDWRAPAGQWIILRIGYTPTGELNGPASDEGTGLEPDALNPKGIDAAFERFMAKLLGDAGPLTGNTLRYCHIDSWETGEQNWTADFPKKFRKRRGYDMLPWLPVMAGGRVVGSLENSERFLWDIRRTIADMLAEYYYGRMREVCHRSGIRFESEAAGAQQFLFDPITFQSQADLPMGEFWVNEGRVRPDCKAAASAANIFGKQFVGAEAFTSGWTTARWTQHPYTLKPLGDEALCMGVNRFVFHRYAMQPWIGVRPGMTMGPWGIHFERTNTWWEPGSAWMRYLGRCQSLLQQGRFVGDVLYFTGEGVPNYLGDRPELNPPLPAGYDFDACNAEVLLHLVSVKDGRLVLDNGMQYRVLLLPDDRTMTPKLLERIRELVETGAVVVGPRPEHAPGLTDYPQCDQQVRVAADALWGPGTSPAAATEQTGAIERAVGRGRVFWGLPFEEIFARLDLAPDFDYRSRASDPLRYIHRRNDEADWYFVSNPASVPVEATCAFRVSGRQPELWDPETGSVTQPAVHREADGRTILPIRFEPAESVFVVFRGNRAGASIHTVKRNDEVVLATEDIASPRQEGAPSQTLFGPGVPPKSLYPEVSGSFTVAFWVKPTAPIELPRQSDRGVAGGKGQHFVLFPEQGEGAYGPDHASAGISVGTNGICVLEHSARYFPARLVHETKIDDWTHLALVYEENRPRLYLNGTEVASAPTSSHTVHPCGKQRGGGSPNLVRRLQIVSRCLTPEEIGAIADRSQVDEAGSVPEIEVSTGQPGAITASIWKAGKYALITANGKAFPIEVAAIPEPLQVDGPWEVRFPPGGGAPESLKFEKLISWTEHEQPGVKYFSGTALYAKKLDAPASLFAENRRLYLDLGKVSVIAEVKLNGKALGVLWKPPFRVDVTDVLQPGENILEIHLTNLWPNRLIGDEQFPPDGEYGPPGQDGRILEWPQWLLAGKPRPEPRRLTFSSWKHYSKDSPLLESGLLGPVMVKTAITVEASPGE